MKPPDVRIYEAICNAARLESEARSSTNLHQSLTSIWVPRILICRLPPATVVRVVWFTEPDSTRITDTFWCIGQTLNWFRGQFEEVIFGAITTIENAFLPSLRKGAFFVVSIGDSCILWDWRRSYISSRSGACFLLSLQVALVSVL